jgi:putative PIN family toxin of toxin-antitoxin system
VSRGRRALRVVLDTNVWISGLILPESRSGAILAAVRARRVDPVLSWELAEELVDVVGRAKLRRYNIAEEDVRDLLALLAPDLPTVDMNVDLRDAADAPVVAAAIAGNAEAIVTGDKDLLDDRALRSWLAARHIELLRPTELLERLAT